MNDDTQSLLLALVGGAVLRIAVDDTFLRFVRSWMRVPLLIAGGVLVVLAVVSLWRSHRRGATVPDDAHGGPGTAWLLLLPVLAIFLVAPPALGAYTADRAPATVAEPAGDVADPLPPGNPVTVTLTEYATRAIWDRGRSLEGRRIRMVGFVSTRPAGGILLTRIVVTCCAADARPVRIAVPESPRTFAPDTWVEVVGTYGGFDRSATTGRVPVLRAESVRQVEQPAEPYEH